MSPRRVLISGAGVSGSILAFWLGRNGFQVVVVERSRVGQKLGQGLEIEEPALSVVREMGVLEKLKDIRTGELGFTLVDEHGRSRAHLGTGRMTVTGALEMMRGDMTEIFYKAADESPNVTFLYETAISSLQQTGSSVAVELQNRQSKATTTDEFDFVVGADGALSRTRDMVLGKPDEINCFHPVGAYVAYFAIPREEQDWPFSKLCNYKGGRVVWMRPTGSNSTLTSVYLMIRAKHIPSLRRANASGDRMKQKEALAEIFAGLGWEVPRILREMMKTDNFYSDELAQVKLPKWSNDRVVLLGDAAWAPTPFTGAGNHLAIIGAWVLAQELTRNPSVLAFEKYEQRLRPYVEKAQKIPLRGRLPILCMPNNIVGIELFRAIVGFFAILGRLLLWTSRLNGTTEELQEVAQDPFDLQIENDEKKDIL